MSPKDLRPDDIDDEDNFETIEMPCPHCGGTEKVVMYDEDFDCANGHADCPHCASISNVEEDDEDEDEDMGYGYGYTDEDEDFGLDEDEDEEEEEDNDD